MTSAKGVVYYGRGERHGNRSTSTSCFGTQVHLRTTDELLEWHALRQWVDWTITPLTGLPEYRSQHYFSCSEEVTKNEVAPKNPSSIFSRFLDLFRK